MKGIYRVTLLLLWLFAITAPSLITLYDTDNAIVVNNLNEEEQQESGKKSQAEEKFVDHHILDFALTNFSLRPEIGDYHRFSSLDHTLEVLSPPPEYNL
ncbi:hypothetical protein [Pseudozobellia thermophila]|uniref:Uncharacterized protein n=1 Tax=Pseudozobellia thermophila TaxID=192903 RepID=A0A1M6B004_9FLAO|nr:hypothetical protein [Pseudozobellia thermophila]SHI42021.1 hypothetical protein SAMN04488513_101240 [Pseudozobellia thermophila]